MIRFLPIARIVSRPWHKPHLRILYFHGIETPFIDRFRQHLDHFAQFFRWISLSEAVRMLEKGELSAPSAVVTFDDADKSVYENGLPVLAEKRIPYCIFAVPHYLDVGKTFREKRPRSVMTWQELGECLSGGAEIGNHTFSHVNLARCSEVVVRDEVLKGKSVLEDRLGIPIVYFAHPYGQFTQKTRQIIRNLGCCQIQATT
jgi:peptidoglycan/xylan/chitin deacetylase (PgdA/CDA1 family)